MSSPLIPVDISTENLPRGLFGYRATDVERSLKALKAQDEMETGPWREQMQRLEIELSRLQERQKTLGNLYDHVQLECDRLQKQLTQEHANEHLLEDGVRHEIQRLQRLHLERMKLFEAAVDRAEIESQSREKKLWQLIENLNQVLQTSQNMANQEFVGESLESLWEQFCQTVLGETLTVSRPEKFVPDLLEQRQVPGDTIQVSARGGERVGYLSSVILSLVPPALVAYHVPGVGLIPANDAQILRLRHITVQSQFSVLHESDLISVYQPRQGADNEESPCSLDKKDGDRAKTPELLDGAIAADPASNRDKEDKRDQPHEARPEATAIHEPSQSHTNLDGELPRDTLTAAAAPTQSTADNPVTPSVTTLFNVGSLDTPPRDQQESVKTLEQQAQHVIAPPSWSQTLLPAAPQPHNHWPLPGILDDIALAITADDHTTNINADVQDDALPGLDRRPTLSRPTWTDLGSPAETSATIPATDADASRPSRALDAEVLDVRAILAGKRVGRDIADSTGNLLAKSGNVITLELIERVERAGLLPDLIVHMEF